MTQLTRRLLVLVSAFAMLALALAAVGPVLAQDNSGDTTGQDGQMVTIQEGDTLGDLIQQNNISETNLGLFVNRNADLVVSEGQTVSYPQGIQLDMSFFGSGAADAGADTAGSDTTGSDTAGSDTTGSDTAGSDTAGDVAGAGEQAFVCDPATAVAGETYVTENGVTLGQLLQAMGYDYKVIDSADSQGQAGQQNLVDFVNLNCDLALDANQQLTVPAAVPVTGQDDTAGDVADDAADNTVTDDTADNTVTDDTTGDVTSDTTDGTTADTTVGTDTYTTLDTDTLGSLLSQWNLSGEQLRQFLDDNGDLEVAGGQQVQIPQGLEFDAGNDRIQNNVYTTEDGENLGDIYDAIGLNLTGRLLGGDQTDDALVQAFVDSNSSLMLVGGQDVETPDNIPATGAVTDQQDNGDVVGQDTTDNQDAAGDQDTTDNTVDQGDQMGDLTLDSAMSLGDLLDRYNLTSDAEIAAFVRDNRSLNLEAGQTVTAPASIPETGAQDQQDQQNQAGQQDQTTGQQDQTTGQQNQAGGQVSSDMGVTPSLNLGLGTQQVPDGKGIYIVQDGDSLSSIARMFDVSVQELLDMNPNTIVNGGEPLFRGQRIYVPGVESPPGGWQMHMLDMGQPSQ